MVLSSSLKLVAIATLTFASPASAELACLWLSECDQGGECRELNLEGDPPGFFIARARDWDDQFSFEQDTGTFTVETTQSDGDALIFDVTFISKTDGSIAFFGQKDNRYETLVVAANGTAHRISQYPEHAAAYVITGKCEGEF